MNNRNFSLDIIRSLAIFQVLIYHLFYRWSEFIGVNFNFFNKQWLGVNLFFILSGYLISKSIRTHRSNIYFFKKRLKRILPAFYITLFIISIINYFEIYSNNYSGWLNDNFYKSLIFNMIFIPEGALNNYFYLDGVFWSLVVEFQFYLICTLFFFKKEVIKYLLILLAILSYSNVGNIDNFLPLARYSAWFLIGLSSFEKNKTFFTISIILSLGSFYDDLIGMINASLIIFIFYFFEKLNYNNIPKIFKFLSKYSYEIYLIHQTVLFSSLIFFKGYNLILITLSFSVIGAVLLSNLSSYTLNSYTNIFDSVTKKFNRSKG